MSKREYLVDGSELWLVLNPAWASVKTKISGGG